MIFLSILDFKIISLDEYSLTIFNVISIALVLFLTKVLLILFKKLSRKYSKRLQIDNGRYQSIYLILKYFVWVFSILICLEIGNIKMTFFLAGGAALLVGLGFGLQNIFSDFVSGVAILFEGTIEIGNIIEVEKVIGKVEKISLRNTQVITRDGFLIIIPNHKFVSENVINWSHHNNNVRFSINVKVAYGSDTRLVSNILLECVQKHSLALHKPLPMVRFEDFGDSGLEFKLFFWSKEVFNIEIVLSDIRFMIDKQFREHNISIPFPQRDLHIKRSDNPFQENV